MGFVPFRRNLQSTLRIVDSKNRDAQTVVCVFSANFHALDFEVLVSNRWRGEFETWNLELRGIGGIDFKVGA